MSILYLAGGFAVMLALMFSSLPVAFAIIFVGTLGGFLAFGMPLVDTMGGVVWSTLNNSVMTAIPLFMLLGELLLRGGIADKMFDALSGSGAYQVVCCTPTLALAPCLRLRRALQWRQPPRLERLPCRH